MKTSFLTLFGILLLFTTVSIPLRSQIILNDSLTPVEMVEFLVGYGINFSNVEYTGADTARGIFDNGSSTNLGVNQGLVLTSGCLGVIPGPNDNGSAGISNNEPGDSLLTSIVNCPTYDASVIEFDFEPVSDLMWCKYVFGSEEYPEWVGSTFNDVFGFFVTGPDPSGGMYINKNIALVPGTNIPVAINSINSASYPEFYVDNLNGQTIQYDGFTTVLDAMCPVIPGETYHIKMAVADASDGIFDSGVFIEKSSFESQGYAIFNSYAFLQEYNPGLEQDIEGVISGNNVYLGVPEGTDLSSLIATFEMPAGVVPFIGNNMQVSGVTANNFTSDVNYLLDGRVNTGWTVKVSLISGVEEPVLPEAGFITGPSGRIMISNAQKYSASVFTPAGIFVNKFEITADQFILPIMQSGIYFIKLETEGHSKTHKVVVP